jgi:ABC-2 type transport system permease protein
VRERLRVLWAGARVELELLNRRRLVVALTVLEAITFLVLVSLFGLTGSMAPTALVDLDHGPRAQAFVRELEAAHHSFSLRPMGPAAAKRQIASGRLVASITIPKGFSDDVSAGRTVSLPIVVDNLDTDLTDDIREAVPSAITAFGRHSKFPGVRVVAAERDLIPRDTGYVPYLIVSALALDALVVAGVLGALAITSEFEGRTMLQWRLAPVPQGWLLAGKLLAAAALSLVAVAAATLVVLLGYGVSARNMLGVAATLTVCVAIFTCFGAAAGALIRRTLPVAVLFFGLTLPVYIVSGALEPSRFDGEKLWKLGHASPVYSAVALLEGGFHGLRVTPESTAANAVTLGLWALVAAMLAGTLVRRRTVAR